MLIATVSVVVDLFVSGLGIATGCLGGLYLGTLTAELGRRLGQRRAWPAIDPLINWEMVDELLEGDRPEDPEPQRDA